MDSLHKRYFAQLTVYQLLIALQMMLVITSWVQFRQKSNPKQSVNKRIKWGYSIVIIVGTLIFLLVEWYGIADFLYDFAKYEHYCTIAAILGNILLITYLFALYMFYLLRIYTTFAPSAHALSSKTIKVLITTSIIIYVTLIICVLIFERTESISVQFAWTGKKQDYQTRIICDGEFSIMLLPSLRIALEGIIIIGNLFYGWLFYYKLTQIMKAMSNYSQRDIESNRVISRSLVKLYSLMKKQTLLVLLATMSTVIFWSIANIMHFYGSFLQIFVYIDISINSLCLWMMFGWNDKYYRKYCICAWCLGITIFKICKNEQMKMVSSMKKSVNKDTEVAIGPAEQNNNKQDEEGDSDNTHIDDEDAEIEVALYRYTSTEL